MNPQNGKGSAPRKGANDKKFKDNYDAIFGKCKMCGMKPCKISCPTRSVDKWKELYDED